MPSSSKNGLQRDDVNAINGLHVVAGSGVSRPTQSRDDQAQRTLTIIPRPSNTSLHTNTIPARNLLNRGVLHNNLRSENRNSSTPQRPQTSKRNPHFKSTPSRDPTKKRLRSSSPQQVSTKPKRPRIDLESAPSVTDDADMVNESPSDDSTGIEEITVIPSVKKGKGRATESSPAGPSSSTTPVRQNNAIRAASSSIKLHTDQVEYLIPSRQSGVHTRWSDDGSIQQQSSSILGNKNRRSLERDIPQSDSPDPLDSIHHEDINLLLTGTSRLEQKKLANPSLEQQKGSMTLVLKSMAKTESPILGKSEKSRHSIATEAGPSFKSTFRLGSSSATPITVEDANETSGEFEEDPIDEEGGRMLDNSVGPHVIPIPRTVPTKDTEVIPNGTVGKTSRFWENRGGMSATTRQSSANENSESIPPADPQHVIKPKLIKQMQPKSGIKGKDVGAAAEDSVAGTVNAKTKKQFFNTPLSEEDGLQSLYNGNALPLYAWCHGSRCYTSDAEPGSVDALLDKNPTKRKPSYWIHWHSTTFTVVTDEFLRQHPTGSPINSPPAMLIIHPIEITSIRYTKANTPEVVIFLHWNPLSARPSRDESDPAKDMLLFRFDVSHSDWNRGKYNALLKKIRFRESLPGGVAPGSALLQIYVQEIMVLLSEAQGNDQASSTSSLTENSTRMRPSSSKSAEADQLQDEPQENEELVSETAPRRSARRKNLTPGPVVALTSDTELILIYPPLNISKGDLARLEPDEYLNDTLIEFGLKLWMNELQASNPALAEQIWVFNSFFYKKLSDKSGDGYNSVKKWTSKIDIFKKQYIIVPINEQFHWYLAIIYKPEYTLLAPIPPDAPQRRRKTRASAKLADGLEPIDRDPDASTRTITTRAPRSASGSAMDQDEVSQILGDDNTSMATAEGSPNPVLPQSPAKEAKEVLAQDEDGDIVLFSHPSSPQPKLFTRVSSPDQLNGAVKNMHLGQSVEQERDDELEGQNELELEYPAPDIATLSDEVDELQEDDTKIAPFEIVATLPEEGDSDPSDSEQNASQKPEDLSALPDLKEDALGRQGDSGTEQPPSLNTEMQKTAIYILDSLNLPHSPAIRNLKNWLKAEAADKKGLDISRMREAAGSNCQALYQPNSVDCGVYLLHFAETFMKDPAKFVEAFNTKSLKEHSKRAIFWEKERLETKREDLKSRILQLSHEWKAKNTGQNIDGSSSSITKSNIAQPGQEESLKDLERRTARERPPTVLSSRQESISKPSRDENVINEAGSRATVEGGIQSAGGDNSDDEILEIRVGPPKTTERKVVSKKTKRGRVDGSKESTAARIR